MIYTRVSTEEQARSGYSLRLQEERLRTHCRTRGIEVVAHFQDDASAKTFNRPGFQEALAVIRRRDPAINLLLFYRWDRFSRNAAQALAMIDEVQALGAEPNAVEEPVDYAQPHAILMQLVHLGVAQADNQMRSRRVREGMRRALREGRWVNRPPVGYRAERDGRRKPILVPDERAPLVREAFELVATGHLGCEEVRRRLVKRGLKIGRSKFTEMLKNVLYCGLVRVPAWRTEPEELVRGVHEPLVAPDLFDRVQDVLAGRRGPRAGKPSRIKPELPLRGYLVCASCGGKMTGGRSRGNGGVYWYYHCPETACRGSLRAPEVHAAFERRLAEVAIPREVARLYAEILAEESDRRHATRNERLAALDAELAELDEKLGITDERYVEGALAPDSYGRLKRRYSDRVRTAEVERSRLASEPDDLAGHTAYGLSLVSNLPAAYASAPLEAKRDLVGLLFPGRLVYANERVRTPELHPVLRLLACREAENGRDRAPGMAPGPGRYRVRDLNPCDHRERVASWTPR